MTSFNIIFIVSVLISSVDSLPRPPAHESRLFCEYCSQVTVQAIQQCQGASSLNEVKTRLVNFCDQFHTGSLDFVCKLIVDEGAVYIWEVVKNGGGSPGQQAADVCSCVGLCTDKCKLDGSSSVSVIPLVEGTSPLLSLENPFEGYSFVSSNTLVRDGQTSIVVDTPTGPDAAGAITVTNVLARNGLTPAQVQILVNTHGHPDHYGHESLFSNALQYSYMWSHVKNHSYTILYYPRGVLQLTTNVQIWRTPGHTPQDVSLIVKNVPQRGTVAVVGDLIINVDDALSPNTTQIGLAWDIPTLKESRSRVLCAVEYIVPGHGSMFQVTAQMRIVSNCST